MDNYSTPRRMKMVGDFFEKYRTRFIAPQASVEKACAKAIQETTGFSIAAEQITYTVNTKTISIQSSSLIKSELRFHHSKILAQLEKELGKSGSPKVIL